MLTQCTSPLETNDGNGIVNETSAPVFSEAQTKNMDHVDEGPTPSQQTLVPLAQEPAVEAQNGPTEEQALGLPDEIKGTEKQNWKNCKLYYICPSGAHFCCKDFT